MVLVLNHTLSTQSTGDQIQKPKISSKALTSQSLWLRSELGNVSVLPHSHMHT